jgi:hypothetical protein
LTGGADATPPLESETERELAREERGRAVSRVSGETSDAIGVLALPGSEAETGDGQGS